MRRVSLHGRVDDRDPNELTVVRLRADIREVSAVSSSRPSRCWYPAQLLPLSGSAQFLMALLFGSADTIQTVDPPLNRRYRTDSRSGTSSGGLGCHRIEARGRAPGSKRCSNSMLRRVIGAEK